MTLTEGGEVGINTENPEANMHVNGTFRLNDGTEQPNFILKSDGNGNASWTDPATISTAPDDDWTVNLLSKRTFLTNTTHKVGIGTSTPVKNLHIKGISGGIIKSTALRLEDQIEDINGNILNNVWWDMIASGGSFYINTESTNLPGEKNIMTLTEEGNVGFGTTTPGAKLSVHSTDTIIAQFLYYNNNNYPRLNITGSTNKIKFQTDYSITGGVDLSFGTYHSPDAFIIKENGSVGIGTDSIPDDFKLAVCGKIKAKELELDFYSWCDYVFEEGYKRMTWKEKELFYKKYNHLPYIAPARQIVEEGLEMGETIRGVTKNVEENRLDITDLYKMYKELKKKFYEIKNENTALKQRIQKLELQ